MIDSASLPPSTHYDFRGSGKASSFTQAAKDFMSLKQQSVIKSSRWRPFGSEVVQPGQTQGLDDRRSTNAPSVGNLRIQQHPGCGRGDPRTGCEQTLTSADPAVRFKLAVLPHRHLLQKTSRHQPASQISARNRILFMEKQTRFIGEAGTGRVWRAELLTRYTPFCSRSCLIRNNPERTSDLAHYRLLHEFSYEKWKAWLSHAGAHGPFQGVHF